jgi:hypothetical protein
MTEEFEPTDEESDDRHSGIGDLASRLLRVGTEAVNVGAEKLREKGEDLKSKEVLSGAVNLTAKGKEELFGLVGGEVRGYLSKMRLGDELKNLFTHHSLEVTASIRLKPVPKDEDSSAQRTEEDPPSEEPAASEDS